MGVAKATGDKKFFSNQRQRKKGILEGLQAKTIKGGEMMFFDELHKQGEEMPHLKHFEKDGIEIKRGFTFDAGKVMNRLWNEGFSTWYCSAHYYWAMINKEKKQIVFNTEGDIDTVKCKDYVALSKEVKRTLDFLKGYDKSLFEEALNYIEDTILLVEYRENA